MNDTSASLANDLFCTEDFLVALVADFTLMLGFAALLYLFVQYLQRDHERIEESQRKLRDDTLSLASDISRLRIELQSSLLSSDISRLRIEPEFSLLACSGTERQLNARIDELKRENEALRRENLRLIGLLTPSIVRTQENEQDEDPEPAGC